MEYLNLSRAAHMLAKLTGDPRATGDTQAIIGAGAQGRIPIYWRNSAQVWTRLSDFKGDLKGTDSAARHLQLEPSTLAQLETSLSTTVLSFALTDQDLDTLTKLFGNFIDGDGNLLGYRHPVGDEVVAITRDQLRVNTDDLQAYAATLAPDAAPKALVVDQVQAATWHLHEPIRDDGLAQPLYIKLKEYRDAGKKIPAPKQVLSDWSASPPPEITVVTKTGLKFIPTGRGSGR